MIVFIRTEFLQKREDIFAAENAEVAERHDLQGWRSTAQTGKRM